MKTYPIFLNSENIYALVLGAGSVALRKIETLLQQEIKKIDVYDPFIEEKDFLYTTHKSVSYFQKNFPLHELDKYNLVFIATNDLSYNSYIVQECKARHIFSNVISNPYEGDFFLPALIQKGDICLTISTSGLSPALSRSLKKDIEYFLAHGYVDLCAFLGRLRPLLLALNLPQEDNAKVFRFFVEQPYKELFLRYFSEKTVKNQEEVLICLENFFQSEVQFAIKEALCLS